MNTNDPAVGFLAMFIAIAFLIMLLIQGCTSAIDRHIENQDTMLCESAKVSGNVQYLHKCECYYQGEDINCLQKGEK